MSKLVEMTGQRWGNLTVIRRKGMDERKQATWVCRCDCGNEIVARGTALRRGHKKSCGCLQKKNIDAYCEYCGEPLSEPDRRFCSHSCSTKAFRNVERVEVDLSYDWNKAGYGLWHCRYRKNIQCKDRNCAKCGWNPEVAEARSKAIMEQRKVEAL